MPKVIYTALAPYTGRAIRFESTEGEVSFKIMESAEKNAGADATRSVMMAELQRETIRVCLRGITAKQAPFVMKKVEERDAKGKPLRDADGKPIMVDVIDEDATLKAIEKDEDALAKGCVWRAVGHLDMITADSETHLYKLFPLAAELIEVAAIIERAGARPRLPLSGKARMMISG